MWEDIQRNMATLREATSAGLQRRRVHDCVKGQWRSDHDPLARIADERHGRPDQRVSRVHAGAERTDATVTVLVVAGVFRAFLPAIQR